MKTRLSEVETMKTVVTAERETVTIERDQLLKALDQSKGTDSKLSELTNEIKQLRNKAEKVGFLTEFFHVSYTPLVHSWVGCGTTRFAFHLSPRICLLLTF